MPTFLYNKLVRDNIWRWHEENGHTVHGQVLTGAALRRKLCDKLHEEADEVDGALGKAEMTEEIGDVRQILDDLCAEEGISEADVQAAQAKKLARKGGFRAGCYIESVTIPDENDTWAQYCRREPDKYPEINEATGKVDPVLPVIKKGIYRHTKSGRLYEVIGVTFHTETREPLVIYRPQYDSSYELFARPYAVFTETIELEGEVKPRFEMIDRAA